MSTMDALRNALPPADSPRFWRALDELSADPVRHALLVQAMPQLASLEPALDRRGFLKLLGASLAFAGLSACSGPPPENIVAEPGGEDHPLREVARYATALDLGGDVAGVVATLRDGRPVKLDGNPRHPMTLGGSDARLQAAILDVWDPERSSDPRFRGMPSDWGSVDAFIAGLRDRYQPGAPGLHVVTGVLRSPTLERQRDAFLKAFPAAAWHIHEPLPVPGAPVALDDARVVLAIDADLLGTWPGHIGMARGFAKARSGGARLYAIEPTPSLTGRNADHAMPVSASDLPTITAALLTLLEHGQPSGVDAVTLARLTLIADDLRSHAPHACVVAGAWTDPAVQSHVARMQSLLGLPVTEAPAMPPRTLTDDLRAGAVETLLVLDCNPAYAMPGFAALAKNIPTIVHLGRYRDETSKLATWHLPCLHPLETWSDLRAADGTVSIVQPVLAPLLAGRGVHDILAGLLGDGDDALTRVRRTWSTLDDAAWRQALRDGVVSAGVPLPQAAAGQHASGTVAKSHDGLEVVFRPDPNLWDGRHAGNAWLQELPRAITSQTWGNAFLISPALAQSRGLADGDIVRVEAGGSAVEGPVLAVPGQADRTITVVLGGGRREGLGTGYGYDGYRLREHDQQWHANGATLTAPGRSTALALTQSHQDMGTRQAIRVVTPDAPAVPPPATPPTFYPDQPAGEYRWAMSIDLAACIGCNACTVACQAENNIPVVGREEVARGRRMHWIRVDTYFEGSAAAPRAYHQPVPCMHCEHAPCEVVCPVEATVHDSEGLNLQVYNRCIGTRFCANNCPYKVRRFNFLQYADLVSESLKAMRNPEVTVREKGVMEKCTYCVQRIEGAHAAAIREQRRIGPNEVTTACQDACPAAAIQFGQLDTPTPALANARTSGRRYVLLEELNTRPRTTYLAAMRNPHPRWNDA